MEDYDGIAQPNTIAGVCDVGGNVTEESRRPEGCAPGGVVPQTCDFTCLDDYVWQGMQGATLASLLLARNGAPEIWGEQSNALQRAGQFCQQWRPLDDPPNDTDDDVWVGWVLRHAYSTSTIPRTVNDCGENFCHAAWLYDPALRTCDYFADDLDFDAVCDGIDNCPFPYNPSQSPQDDCTVDSDGDLVTDGYDNCTFVANPQITRLAFQTTTGYQLDDDADGFGNRCDADYNNAGGSVDSSDLALFKVAFGKNRNSSSCNPGGTSPCDRYDHNNVSSAIDSADFALYKTLFGKTKKSDGDIMDRCPNCPLTCEGDACP
jgi:hypothetical protein